VARRRGLVIALSVVGLMLFFAVALVVLVVVMASRGPSVPQSSTLVLRPGGALGK
jgi:hypothetical protein